MAETAVSALAYAEMMITMAARQLVGARTVFVGVGLPNMACNLARYTVAPGLELIYESGVYGAQPMRLPLSIGDPTLVTGALSVVSMADLFGLSLDPLFNTSTYSCRGDVLKYTPPLQNASEVVLKRVP